MKGRVGKPLTYGVRRLWAWWMSLRLPLLVFVDTFFSVLVGRNILRSSALGDEVVRLQWSVSRAVERVRQQIDRAVRRALLRGQRTAELLREQDEENAVRVNISVLSADGSRVFYIAWERGSMLRVFEKHSIAWVAVNAGEARWWKKSYQPKSSSIVLFDNTGRRLPEPGTKLMLNQYFQDRGPRDYEAFIVLPVPWNRRGSAAYYVPAAIHISFAKEEYLNGLWKGLDSADREPKYDDLATDLLTLIDGDELRAVLRGSVEILEELLRSFNEAVFELHIRPRLLA